jgi:hypothetical protein
VRQQQTVIHRRKTMSRILLLIGSTASIFLSNVALAQAPSIGGNWKMSFIGEDLSPTYTLIQKGNGLTGTFRAPIGDLPLTGTVKGNQINFTAKFRGKSLDFTGTVSGATMKGLADLPMKGRKQWTATKY